MRRTVLALVLVAAVGGACGGGGPSKEEVASSSASASRDASASDRSSVATSKEGSRAASAQRSSQSASSDELSASAVNSSWESSKSLSAVAVVSRLAPAYKEARSWITEHQSSPSLRSASPALKEGLDKMVEVMGEVSAGLAERVDEPGYREALAAWALLPADAAEAAVFCDGSTGQTLCDELLREFFEGANPAIAAIDKLGLG